jgi:predicted NUDIX family NTP pyrophosphohydrolase
MTKRSAGILMFRHSLDALEVFLVHPGGPFWAKKDDGAWSIPKGLQEENENPLDAARREFQEETGRSPEGNFLHLGDFKQPSGKIISAWAVEGSVDESKIKSNLFSMEWPPKSGHMQEFPEVDRAAWFNLHRAMQKVTNGQMPILHSLSAKLGGQPQALSQVLAGERTKGNSRRSGSRRSR